MKDLPFVPTERPANQLRDVAIRLAALAQAGLTYAEGEYDLDRYQKIRSLAVDVLADLAGCAPDELRQKMDLDVGYTTPKVDVRGAVFDASERILMMRERGDGLWSLPGGWADPGDTPAEAVKREVLEETGVPVEVVKLIGVWDRDRKGHTPPLPAAVYKLFFLCEVSGPATAPSELETMEVAWATWDSLPPLSLSRVTREELDTALAHFRNPNLLTEWN